MRGLRSYADVTAADKTLRGLQQLQHILPADLPTWSRQNHHWPGHPAAGSLNDQIWPDGTDHGVVRAYAATRGDQWVMLLIGIRDHVTLELRAVATVDVYAPVAGLGDQDRLAHRLPSPPLADEEDGRPVGLHEPQRVSLAGAARATWHHGAGVRHERGLAGDADVRGGPLRGILMIRWLRHPHADPLDRYWDRVRAKAKELKTDGCSSWSQVYIGACLEHDIHHRTRRRLYSAKPIGRLEADWLMLLATMARSPFRALTPIGWLRFVVLRCCGWHAWKKNARRRQI